MMQKEVTIVNKLGLHARAAAKFVTLASSFSSDIDISKEPMLIYPTLHYQNGGLKIDDTCETDVENLYAAGEVTTPLLLLHGDADTNVTPGESQEMFTALQVQGKPVEMVTFAGEDHGIAGSWANYVGHRTMMLEWFDRWLKGQGEAWEARWAD